MSKPATRRQSIVFIYCGLSLFLGSAQGAEVDSSAVAALHLSEAVEYGMFLDELRTIPLELEKNPIFKWQNLMDQGQLGSIFVWTRDGRPEVVGSIFSQTEQGKRIVIHEFHTLSDKMLTIRAPKGVMREWKPQSTLAMKKFPNATAVADTPAQRMFQMRSLSRDFSAYTKRDNERIELRLATQPMIRYQPTRGDVLDGALFAFLSSAAGTDPEVILQIEARKADSNSSDWTWKFGIVRFSDRDLVVLHKDVELYSSISNAALKVSIEDNYKWLHTKDETYSVFRAKVIPELSKAADKQ